MRKIIPAVRDLDSLLAHTKPEGDCLIWQNGKTPSGYGKTRFNGKTTGTHRLALFFTTQTWGQCALHLCDTPACVNPDHLQWGSYSQNSSDMVNKDRQAKGSRIAQSKLTEEQAKQIKQEYALGIESWRSLGIKYGVSKTVIGYIVKNKFWTHI